MKRNIKHGPTRVPHDVVAGEFVGRKLESGFGGGPPSLAPLPLPDRGRVVEASVARPTACARCMTEMRAQRDMYIPAKRMTTGEARLTFVPIAVSMRGFEKSSQ